MEDHHHHHHHHPDHDDEDSSGLLTAKVVAMVVLGLASFIVGVVPIKLTKIISIKTADKDKNLIISLLLCFGGGVLLFTTFLHLQPEVREALNHFEEEQKVPKLGHGLPMSELVFCIGFFFVYLIEEVVHLVLHRKKISNEALHRSLSVRCNKDRNMTIPRVNLNKFEDGIVSFTTSTKDLLTSHSNVNAYTSSSSSQSSSSSSNNEHSHVHPDSMKNSFRGLLAVLALSFHAVFEGLAVGLEHSVHKVWYLFIAIATHKLVIAFCVGVELAASKTKTVLFLVYIGTFAVVTPLGIGIGIALSETGGSQEDVASVILQGMAAGTLLYVVFFEVLARERNNNHHSGIWQLLAILAGFAVMLGLQYVTGHSHSHGGSGSGVQDGDEHNHVH